MKTRFLVLLSSCFIPVSQAALEIVVEEVTVSYGTDVRMRWSGSLDTTGVNFVLIAGTSISGGVHPGNGGFFGYDPGGSTIDLSQTGVLSPGTILFGAGTFAGCSAFDGLPFGLDGAGRIGVPSAYVSGTPLEGFIRFPNTNLGFLGLDPESGPAVWTLPSGDTITLSFSEQTVVEEGFDTGGATGDVVSPLTYGDLTVTITDLPATTQEPRILQYGDAGHFGFVGTSEGMPADPSAVSPSRYIASAGATGGAFAFEMMEFAFSQPVRSFGLKTIDMVESVNGATPLILTALGQDDVVVAQTVVDSPPNTGNGVVFALEVAASGNDILKVRFEGPPTGHGIDDLVIVRDPGGGTSPPASALLAISPPPGWDRVYVKDMSDDATKLVGRLFRSSDFTYQGFLWSEADGFTLLDGLVGIGDDSITAISGDGNVVLGSTPFGTNDDRSWIYRSGTTTAVPVIGGTEGNSASALSTDGGVLAGICDTNLSSTTFAFRPASWTWNGSSYVGSSMPSAWPAVTEFQDQGSLEAVSGDGRYLFGRRVVFFSPVSENSYRFDRVSGSIENISSPNNLNIVQSTADGSQVLAYRSRSYAYLWKPGVGIEQLENRPPAGLTGYSYRAIGMSEDTERIIAFEDAFAFGSPVGLRLVYWNENRELRSFLTVVEALGLDLTGWTISSLSAISTDGLVIAGEATVNGVPSGFLLTLPAGPLPANRLEGILVGPDGFFDPEDGEEVTGLTADGDGDGVANMVEIALGVMDGSGGVAMNDPSDPSSVPQIGVTVDDPMAPQIALTTIRRRDITGLTVGMECSADLEGGWSSAGVTESVTPIDATWEQVTFTAPAGPECQLARLVVNYVE